MVRLAIHINFAIELNGKRALTRNSWRRLTYKVKERDAATCYYCGRHAPDGHTDHIIPLSRGGSDDLENLVWACSECNLAKGDMTLQEWREKQEQDRQEQQRVREDQKKQEQEQRKHILALASEGKSQREIELEVIEMYQAGESKRAIQRAIFGYIGGAAYDKVNDILSGITTMTDASARGRCLDCAGEG